MRRLLLQSYEQLSQAAQDVTLEEVNGLCRSLLSFASHYGREDELAEEARQQPEQWTQGPPTRATSIVACVPMHVDASGQSIGVPLPLPPIMHLMFRIQQPPVVSMTTTTKQNKTQQNNVHHVRQRHDN